MQKPSRRYENTVKVADDVLPTSEIASGSRWRKAPHICPPADKATRTSTIVSIISSLTNRVEDPTQSMRLITNVQKTMRDRWFIYLPTVHGYEARTIIHSSQEAV